MEELPADVCGEMLDSLYDRPSFAQWKGTFGKALQAHTRGDFELSIPIWLLAIDGISSQELMVSSIYSKVQGKRAPDDYSTNCPGKQSPVRLTRCCWP